MNFSFWNLVLAALTLLSFVLTFWRWFVARRFPLHSRSAENNFCPAVTLLKPIKGADSETRACLQSWLAQSYSGPVQILFAVGSADDPACEVVRDLLQIFPQAGAQLIVCPERRGANGKISKLVQIEPHICHEIVIISDADVFVPADFLANVVQPLRGEKIGLVNCFYCLTNPTTLAMRWEAIAINADFWSQVLQSQSLKKVDFALGAVMATTRAQLKKIGGFQSLADYLADDYQLGNQISKNADIVFCPVVVDCREKPMTWKQVFLHQLRWARTIRICQPVPFFFSILGNATLWPLLWWLLNPMARNYAVSFNLPDALHPVSSVEISGQTSLTLGCFAVCLVFRIATALHCQTKLTRSVNHFACFWLVPIKDLLEFVIWALAFIGDKIEWRGERYQVLLGGKLQKL